MKRYTVSYPQEDFGGEYILFTDHQADKEAAIRALLAEVQARFDAWLAEHGSDALLDSAFLSGLSPRTLNHDA